MSMMKTVRKVLSIILAHRRVPRHVAFVMDGNRRFADKLHLSRVSGHNFGYQKLLDALEWCLDLGIPCVTVYAFSIENFKRSSGEVETLMNLAEEKFSALLTERDLINQHGVQVRVIGDLSLLPLRVQRAAQRAMIATQANTKGILNICMAYTSSQELAQAVSCLQAQLVKAPSKTADVTSSDLEQHLYTKGCPPVDLLVRTSGEVRLSDFLLWQSSTACLEFVNVYWPEFRFYHLVRAIMAFQQHVVQLDQLRQATGLCTV